MKHGRATHVREVCSTDTQAGVTQSCFFAAQFGTNDPIGRIEEDPGASVDKTRHCHDAAGLKGARNQQSCSFLTIGSHCLEA